MKSLASDNEGDSYLATLRIKPDSLNWNNLTDWIREELVHRAI